MASGADTVTGRIGEYGKAQVTRILYTLACVHLEKVSVWTCVGVTSYIISDKVKNKRAR